MCHLLLEWFGKIEYNALFTPLFMKNILAAVAVLILGASVGRALPADLAPPGGVFGDCARDGTLIVTDDLREADFGGGVRLPVRWVYRSGDQSVSPYGCFFQ